MCFNGSKFKGIKVFIELYLFIYMNDIFKKLFLYVLVYVNELLII